MGLVRALAFQRLRDLVPPYDIPPLPASIPSQTYDEGND